MALGYIVLSFVGAFVLHIIFVKPYFAIEDSIKSYCRLKKKVTFQPKRNSVNAVQAADVGAIKEMPTSTTDCVSVAYSKKLDGL